MPVKVRPYRDEDEMEVIELLKTTLGEGPAGNRTHEFFAWKHLDNPFGRSFMLVAESDGRVVGLRAFMRWRFVAGGARVPAARAVDTATHPDYQGRGIFSRLTLEALEGLADEADFVFNTPNDKSKPGYLKMGWQVVGDLPVRVRVRRPLRFALGLRTIRTPGTTPVEAPDVNAVPAAEALANEEALAGLLQASSGRSGGFATAHTSDTLTWRYGRAPLLDYRAVGDVRRGLAIFRVRARGALWEASVAEVIVPNEDPRRARELLREVGRAARVDHITCLAPASSAASVAARRAGFVRSPLSMTLTARPLRKSRVDPLDGRSWALTLGDVEVF